MNNKNTVVRCTTQEQWDFVTEKLGYKWNRGITWSTYGENTAINLEEIGYSRVAFYKDTKKVILSFEEWCKQNNYTYTKVYTKDDFIIGKWYKFLNTNDNKEWIVKITHFDNGIRGWTKCILNNYLGPKGYHRFIEISNLRELSIEEVQKYLPEDHPDYIKEIQIIKGEVYRVKDKFGSRDWWAIGKATEGINTKLSDKECFRNKATYITSNKEFAKDSTWCYTSSDKKRTFKLATKEEREWLEYCISQGKYVDQDKVPKKLSKDELLKEVKKVPKKDMFLKDEYVVISKDMTSRFAIKDHIYKIRYNNKNIAPYLDSGDSTNNVFGIIYKDSNSWRYATKEEIAEYNRLGKPYDVTSLNKQPEYVECLEWQGSDCKIGEIYPITEYNSNINYCRIKSPHYSGKISCRNGEFKFSTKEAYDAQQNKINTKEKVKSLYWLVTTKSAIFLNKFKTPLEKGNKGELAAYIHINAHSYTKNGGINANNGVFSIPSKEQIDWLEHCIKINKYISFEEFQKLNKTPSIDFKIGDWVQLTNNLGSYRKIESINIEQNYISYIDYIQFGDYNKEKISMKCYTLSRMKKVSLDEIEQYLPKQESKWVPKVGDWIVITKSNKNWGSGSTAMDKYVGNCVQITRVSNNLNRNKTHIRFDNDGGWSWVHEDGHFRQAEPHEIPISYIDVYTLPKSVTMGSILEELSSKVVLMNITLPSSKVIELNLPKKQVELKPLLNIKLEQIKTINF